MLLWFLWLSGLALAQIDPVHQINLDDTYVFATYTCLLEVSRNCFGFEIINVSSFWLVSVRLFVGKCIFKKVCCNILCIFVDSIRFYVFAGVCVCAFFVVCLFMFFFFCCILLFCCIFCISEFSSFQCVFNSYPDRIQLALKSFFVFLCFLLCFCCD